VCCCAGGRSPAQNGTAGREWLHIGRPRPRAAVGVPLCCAAAAVAVGGPLEGGARPRGREGTGPANDRWELDSGSGGYSGGRSADQGQYSGQQGWERGRERGDSEIYPAASQGFRSQPIVVPVSSVVPAGPYGIYGGLAAGQLGLAPMGGRTGAFPPVRGRGPRPPPGPPPGGRGRGRW
jgi:hypothetical protein